MFYCILPYCNVLYCTVLYCILLYSTVMYSNVLYFTILYCTVLYCTVLYCTICNKASGAETVCTNCRHLKQLLSRQSLSVPCSSFHGNCFSCLFSSQMTDSSKLDNKSLDLSWSFPRMVTTTNGINRPWPMLLIPPNIYSLIWRCSRRWQKAVFTYLNTLWYRILQKVWK
jgi:hypothetical protein